MIQRIRDWLLERRIKLLSSQGLDALKAGDRDVARMLWNEKTEAIRSRSAGQIDRMERRILSKMDESGRRIFEKHRVPPRVD